jgi:hypothetical protein
VIRDNAHVEINIVSDSSSKPIAEMSVCLVFHFGNPFVDTKRKVGVDAKSFGLYTSQLNKLFVDQIQSELVIHCSAMT